MYGYALQKARQDLRQQLRHAAAAELPPGQALDLAEFWELFRDGDNSYRSRHLRSQLAMRGVLAAGMTAGQVAEVLHTTVAAVESIARAPLLANAGIALDIEERVRAEIQETADPGHAPGQVARL